MSGRFNRTGITTQQLLKFFSDNDCNYRATHRAVRAAGYDISETGIKQRISTLVGDKSNKPDPEDIKRKLEFAQRFAAKLDSAGIDPSLINLDRMVIKEWQMGYKDADDNGQVLPLEGVTFYASPAFENGPQWTPIHPADGIIVQHTQPPVERRTGEKVAVVATDPQIGYLLELGQDPEDIQASLTPFHDEAAIDVAKQLVGIIRPDRMLHGGDTVDFQEHTRKFRRFPEYARTTQFALQRAHRYFAEFAAAAGQQCEHDVCDGNHDARIANDALDNSIASYGLRTAFVPGETPNDSWPVHSVPYLLRFEYLEAQGIKIRYSAPYPAGRIKLTDHIFFRHDHSIKVSEQAATMLHGHDHKLHVTYRKIYLGGEEVQIATAGCGSLCRNDLMLFDKIRRMPSYVPSGKFEQNWQQGIVVVYYNENGGPDDYDIQPIKIQNGKARYAGQTVEARCDVEGRPRK